MVQLMLAESGMNPRAVNSIGCAGLNQMCGRNIPNGMTGQQYAQLSASEQLGHAISYWSNQIRQHPAAAKGGARDLYWLNFLPASYVANAPNDHVIAVSQPEESWVDANGNPHRLSGVVSQNKGFVLPGEDVIRLQGLVNALDRAVKNNPHDWAASVENVTELGGIPKKVAMGVGTTALVAAGVGGATWLLYKILKG
jgi:hypothetical protein